MLASMFPSSAYCLSADAHAALKSVDLSAVADITDSYLSASPSEGAPQQLHLSLTGDASEMFVTFVLPNVTSPCSDAAVMLEGGSSFPSTHQTYNAGVIGWYGVIYTSRLTGLMPGATYTYTATACGSSASPRSFKAAPTPSANAPTRVIVKADMGTVVPMGFAVAQQIERDHALLPFDLAVLAGDLAYATVSPPRDEFEEVWDAWGRMIEPYTSTLPFMANVGNHEHTPGTLTNSSGTFNVDYAAYMARYAAVPANGNGNLWYSFDFGSAHYTYIDSEEDQSVGSPQLTWLQADLARVNRAITPWLFVFQHRPLLCSTASEKGDHVPGGRFLTNLEATLLSANVDVVITGHEHLYERSNAVRNGTVVGTSTGLNNTYSSPSAPIYIVQGTAGAFLSTDWIDPQPVWSAFRNGASYGYGRVFIDGAHSIAWEFVDINGTIIDHFRIEK